MTNTEHLILTELTAQGFVYRDIDSKEHVLQTHKHEIGLIENAFPNLASPGKTFTYTARECQRKINYVTQSEFPLGVVIFSLYKIGVNIRRNGQVIEVEVNQESFDKYFIEEIRDEMKCECVIQKQTVIVRK